MRCNKDYSRVSADLALFIVEDMEVGSLSLLDVLCDLFASRCSGNVGKRELDELLRLLWPFLFFVGFKMTKEEQ